jgi:hypothetical protein
VERGRGSEVSAQGQDRNVEGIGEGMPVFRLFPSLDAGEAPRTQDGQTGPNQMSHLKQCPLFSLFIVVCRRFVKYKRKHYYSYFAKIFGTKQGPYI